jgi:hypothetical protein
MSAYGTEQTYCGKLADVCFEGRSGRDVLVVSLSAFDPNRTLAGSKSRTATALTELRQSDMVPARLV